MNKTGNTFNAAILYKENFPGRCPLCGEAIIAIYPETAPGIRSANCKSGHKIRLQKQTSRERNAG